MIPVKDLQFILAKGILAPSADNLQPWQFRISEESVTLCLDGGRINKYCDAGNLAPYLSAGAVIENMRVAAAGLNYEMRWQYFPEPVQPLRIARIEFYPAPGTGDPDTGVLEKRCTNRKFYAPQKTVAPEIFESIQKRVPENEGFRLLWVKRNDPVYPHLAGLIGEADRIRFEIPRLHREFMDVLRFSRKETLRSGDGLPLETLEAGPPAHILFPLMRRWSRMFLLNALGMSRLFGMYAKTQMLSSQAAGLIVSSGKNAEDYLRGGEIMQKAWHGAVHHGLSIQPMEALPIFILNASLTGGENLSLKHQKMLARLKERFFSIFGIDNSHGLILFFRIGYGARPAVKSPRRPVETFMLHEQAAESRAL